METKLNRPDRLTNNSVQYRDDRYVRDDYMEDTF